MKSLLQEFEEVVSGRKKLKTFANDAGTKTTRKKLGVRKKNSNRRNISRKSSSKNSCPRKDLFDKTK